MKLKQLWLLFGFFMSLSACKQAKLVSAEKFKIIPGVSTGVSTMRYQLKLSIKNETFFKEVRISDNNVVSKFSVLNVVSNMSGSNNTSYSQGEYILQFDQDVSNGLQANESNKVIVVIGQGEKIKELIANVSQMPDKRLR